MGTPRTNTLFHLRALPIETTSANTLFPLRALPIFLSILITLTTKQFAEVTIELMQRDRKS